MDRLLRDVFDYQHFSPNSALEELIEWTQDRYRFSEALSDDDMELLSAAGEIDLRRDRDGDKALRDFPE